MKKSKLRMKPFPGEGTLGSLVHQSRVSHLEAQTWEVEGYGNLEFSLHMQVLPAWGNIAKSQGGDTHPRDPESKHKIDEWVCCGQQGLVCCGPGGELWKLRPLSLSWYQYNF